MVSMAGKTASTLKYDDVDMEIGDDDLEYKEVGIWKNPYENDMATLFYTSGTTGQPKGVYYSQKQLVLHSLATAVALSAEPTSLSRTAVMLPP